MKGVDVTIHVEKEEELVYCDQSQIKQVILNFAKNAVEAMLEVAHPILDIQTRINDTRNEMLIMITDNGKGIKPEDKSQLGKAFFTTKETGTGLAHLSFFQFKNPYFSLIFSEFSNKNAIKPALLR